MSHDTVQRKPAPTAHPVTAAPLARPNLAAAAHAFAATLKKTGAARSERREAAAQQRAEEDAEASVDTTLCVERQVSLTLEQRQSGQGDKRGAEASAPVAETTASAKSELDALAEALEPLTESDGLFELFLPSGARLAVAVTTAPRHTRLLLSCADPALQASLQRKQTELERRLGQHIGKDVTVAVL